MSAGRRHRVFNPPEDEAGPNARLVLYDIRSPINIGMTMRVAETYRAPIAIYDPSGVMQQADKARTISDFACGALQRQGFGVLETPEDLDRLTKTGRLIATDIVASATPLPEHDFKRSDIFLIGNEYDGLPSAVMARCAARVTIPMEDVWTPKPPSHTPIELDRGQSVSNDGMPNLNAAMSAGVLIYSAFLALRR